MRRVLRPITPWGPKNHGSLEEAVCSMMAAAQSAAVVGSAAVRGHDAANGF